MTKYIKILIFILASNICYSQGFNWQQSPRLPIHGSNLFIGISSEYSLSKENGSFDFYENDCNCGSFDDGSGSGYSIGISSEYWLGDGLTAIKAIAGYSSLSSDFSAYSSLPVLIDGAESQINYQNTYYSDIDYFKLSIGIKRRIPNTFFSFRSSLSASFKLSNNDTHYEKIIGPDWAPPFSTNPPSYKRKVSEGSIEGLRSVAAFIDFGIEYDFALGIGYYASPFVAVELPLSNMTDRGNWKRTSLYFGVSILRWI